MDERLQQLVTEAQRHAPQMQKWQYALTRLVDEMARSRPIKHYQDNIPYYQ